MMRINRQLTGVPDDSEIGLRDDRGVSLRPFRCSTTRHKRPAHSSSRGRQPSLRWAYSPKLVTCATPSLVSVEGSKVPKAPTAHGAMHRSSGFARSYSLSDRPELLAVQSRPPSDQPRPRHRPASASLGDARRPWATPRRRVLAGVDALHAAHRDHRLRDVVLPLVSHGDRWMACALTLLG